jgi:hypothetical protein
VNQVKIVGDAQIKKVHIHQDDGNPRCPLSNFLQHICLVITDFLLSNKDSEGRVGPHIFLTFKIDYRVSQDKNL